MSFTLTILGSNSALPTAKRNTSAHVLCVHERFFLIDCGEGTQTQIRKNNIKISKINNIFISHLHGDHFYGLFGLIETLALLGRTSPLHIFAHARLKIIIESVIDMNFLNFKIEYHALNYSNPQLILQKKNIEIYSFPLKHRVLTCGFLFKEIKKLPNIRKELIPKYNLAITEIVSIKKGSNLTLENGEVIENEKLVIPAKEPRSYAYCSDTSYHKKNEAFLQGVDLLYHEATFDASKQYLAKQTGHSTSVDAANFAKNSNAKKLLLGHLSARYKNGKLHEKQAQAIFPNTTFVNDNDTYIVEN